MTNPPSAAQRALGKYRRAFVAYRRAFDVYTRLQAAAEQSSDFCESDSHYDDVYVPAVEKALDAAVALFEQIEDKVPTIREGMREAWDSRRGEFTSVDDPDMDPESREILVRYEELFAAFPMLDGGA